MWQGPAVAATEDLVLGSRRFEVYPPHTDAPPVARGSNTMRTSALFVAIALVFGCATSMPEKPFCNTPAGKECAEQCLKEYSRCMESEVRPDYLLLSPRKEACGKTLNECYRRCLEKDK
jgi:hypothetical protein